MFEGLFGFDSDLYQQVDRMRREMDRLFGDWEGGAGIRSVAAGTYPPINIGVSPERVDVYLFATGLDPDGFDLSIQQNLLTVSGRRVIEYPEGSQVFRRERFSGEFRRVITLPEDVDPEQVQARYRDGILQITVARRAVTRPRKIEVQKESREVNP